MQEESLTTPHPIVIWSCDSHVISCDLTYDDAFCQIDLTLADIPGTTEQLNNAFGFRHTETLKVGEEEGGKKTASGQQFLYAGVRKAGYRSGGVDCSSH